MLILNEIGEAIAQYENVLMDDFSSNVMKWKRKPKKGIQSPQQKKDEKFKQRKADWFRWTTAARKTGISFLDKLISQRRSDNCACEACEELRLKPKEERRAIENREIIYRSVKDLMDNFRKSKI